MALKPRVTIVENDHVQENELIDQDQGGKDPHRVIGNVLETVKGTEIEKLQVTVNVQEAGNVSVQLLTITGMIVQADRPDPVNHQNQLLRWQVIHHRSAVTMKKDIDHQTETETANVIVNVSVIVIVTVNAIVIVVKNIDLDTRVVGK